eukprot:7218541-Pyramimonas_sp.AAC.1
MLLQATGVLVRTGGRLSFSHSRSPATRDGRVTGCYRVSRGVTGNERVRLSRRARPDLFNPPRARSSAHPKTGPRRAPVRPGPPRGLKVDTKGYEVTTKGYK